MLQLDGGAVGLAFLVRQHLQRESTSAQRDADRARENASRPSEKKTEDYLNEDILRLELGAGLVTLVDPKRGSDIMKRITAVRTELASDLGILLPMVRIRDRLNLPSFTYELSLEVNIVAEETLVAESLLAFAA